MKKAIVAVVLGMALTTASSRAQGYIVMENYKLLNGVTPVFSAVSYSGTNYVGAASGFKADLLYSLDGGATYNLAAGSQTPFFPGSHDGGSPTTDGAGVFVGPNVTIPGYSSGPVWFIVEAYNGSSYGASIGAGKYAGQSAPFSIDSLNTDPLMASGNILQIVGTTPTGLQPFVLIIPEPSVFVLASVGAACIISFRRRK